MTTVAFKTIEEQIRQRFGQLTDTEMDQQIFELAPFIGVEPDAEEVTQEQYQKACQLIEIIYQKQAMNFKDANLVLERLVDTIAQHNPLLQMLHQQSAVIADGIPHQVAAATQETQQVIQYALLELVAQQVGQMDVNARVEEIMKQNPKPQVSIAQMLGLPSPPSMGTKQLPGS